MKKHGAPWLSRSFTSGSARAILRTPSSSLLPIRPAYYARQKNGRFFAKSKYKHAQQFAQERLLAHLSPLPWEHIHLTGDYHWHANKRVAKGGFRPLRQRKDPTIKA
jgi:hypothetical protein